MDKRNPESREVEELLEKKKDLFSLFSAFEDRIDHKISHLTDSAEIPVESIKQNITEPSGHHLEDPAEDLFEQAVLKSQQKTHEDGIIGFHTEEILGVEEALAELKKTDPVKPFKEEPVKEPAEVIEMPEDPVILTQAEPIPSPHSEILDAEPSEAAPQIPADIPLETEVSEPTLSVENQDNAGDLLKERIIRHDEEPMELPLGVDEPDLAEIDELLQEAEELMEDIPYSRYMAARAAVDKEVLDDNPLEISGNEEADFEAYDEDEEAFEEYEPDDSDAFETDSDEYDALFEEDDFEEDEDFDNEDSSLEEHSETEILFGEDEPEDEEFEEEYFSDEDEDEDEDIFQETVNDTIPEDATAHPFADFFEDTAETVKEDLFDELPLDEAPEEEYSDNNLDDVTYENVDAVSLGAFKYSAVSLRLILFVIAMLGMGVFTALSSGRFIAMDYLILFVLCIFVALTMDMSFNATLIVTVVIMLGCFGGLIYTFFTGGEVSMFHMFWFIIIPACLLTASGLVQKIKEVILANQLLNEELDSLYGEHEETLFENVDEE